MKCTHLERRVIPQRYIAASELLGSSVLANNLTPTAAAIVVGTTNMQDQSSQQAQVNVQLAQTGSALLLATSDVTNWSSSNTNVVTVSQSGLITATGGGGATVTAMIDGVSANVSLTVPLAAPNITQEPPASETLVAGGTLHTGVVVDGVPPYFYNWYLNNVAHPVAGGNGAELTVTDVQAASAGSYFCIISNAYGSVTSSPTALSVIAPTVYQANLLTLGATAFWPLNEASGTVAYDIVGGYNGTYVGNVSLQTAGPPGTDFGASSFGATFDGSTAYVDIPEGPFNNTNAITIAAWVNLGAYPNFDGIFGHGDKSRRMSINPSGDPGSQRRQSWFVGRHQRNVRCRWELAPGGPTPTQAIRASPTTACFLCGWRARGHGHHHGGALRATI